MTLAEVISARVGPGGSEDDHFYQKANPRRSFGWTSLHVAHRHRAWLYPAMVPALVAFGVCQYMLALPNALYGTSQYDDGVYVGAAMRLTHGVIPYKDFVVVHPPGIMILLAPVALIGGVLGSNVSLALARELTALVAGANVILTAAAVRHRGWKISLLAATAIACFPMSPAADSTVFLEPYLVFFCLLGLVLLFSNGKIAPPRRCLLAGIALGLAGTVKVWAAMIVGAAAIVCLRRAKTGLAPLLAGTVIGFATACLPFFIAAPHAFVRDILGDQFSRAVSGGTPVGFVTRLSNLTGLSGMTLFHPSTTEVIAVAVCFVAIVAGAALRRRRCFAPVDYAILGAAFASSLTLCLPHEMYAHYVYFSAPFLALLLAVSLSEITKWISERRDTWVLRRSAVTVATCIVAAIFLIPQQAGYARSHLAAAKDPTFLNLFVPPNACIVTDDVGLLVSANLFDPARHGCPGMTDAFGTWLADGPAQEPAYSGTGRFGSTVEGPFSEHFTNEWTKWLSQADYVVTMAQYSGYIPWNPALAAWFNANFQPKYRQPHLWIYQRIQRTPGPVER